MTEDPAAELTRLRAALREVTLARETTRRWLRVTLLVLVLTLVVQVILLGQLLMLGR